MYKYFNINSEKGVVRCKAYYNSLRDIKKAIIVGHGFGGHKDNKAAERFAARVLKKNQGVVIVTFNWPGHGDDTHSKLMLEKCSDYLTAVISYLKEKWGVNSFFGYATSFGGYLFLRYIAEYGNSFEKIALRCPAVRMYDILKSKVMSEDDYLTIKRGKPAMIGFDRKVEVSQKFLDELEKADISNNNYQKYAKDILILHGTKDEIVSFYEVKEFAIKNTIEFLPVEDADHRFLDTQKMDTAIAEILKLFELK